MNGLKQEFSRDESVFELPRAVKLRMIDEILRRLRSSDVKGNVSAQRGENILILCVFSFFLIIFIPSTNCHSL